MNQNRYIENTTVSAGMKPFDLSYDDLVCLKYLLSASGSGKRLERQEYEQLLSDEGKMFYNTIVSRYRSLAHNEKKAYDNMCHNPNRYKMYKRFPSKCPYRHAKQFWRGQRQKVEEALSCAEQERYVEVDLNSLLNKLLPVE